MNKWGLTPFLLSAVVAATAAEIPDYAQVKRQWRSSEAWLLDRNGVELQRLRVDMSVRRFEWVRLDRVSPALKDALLASEDQRFYEHDGVDWKAALNAAAGNLGAQSARGASTISMQLAGMLDPDLQRGDGAKSRTFAQKVRQAGAALQMERRWKKAEILEAYLNLVTFRGELQGVSAMTHGLFGKAPHGLDRREAAIAAALLRGPNADAARVAERACWLLQRESGGKPAMAAASLPAACAGLRSEVRQVFARGYEAFPRTDGAPHAARRVFAQVKPKGGERISSTLEIGIQKAARTALRVRLGELSGRNVEDGAVLVIDNASGDILAYVGSSGDLSRAAQVDGAQALRQAGSTLKPFLYELAIEERRLTAASVLDDSPLQIRTDSGLYVPRNYVTTYRGPVSVRASLAGSLNVPAVRALLLVGPDRLVERLRDLGLDSVSESGDYYGPSLALGSADVSLLALTNAYRSLANGGTWTPALLTPVRQRFAGRRVMQAAASHVVTDILADRAARAATFGLASALETPFWTAVKTGTSKDMRDNWAVGFSSRYTVGVWVGNAGGSPMHDVSGVSGAAPIWRDVMLSLHRHARGVAPSAPPDSEMREIRFEPAIEPPRTEWFVAGTAQSVVRLAASHAAARITSPPNGAIIALDPDVPPRNQRVQLIAAGADKAFWELDGKALASAEAASGWFPWPGRHTLTLRDARGEVLDRSQFEVRGATVRGRSAVR